MTNHYKDILILGAAGFTGQYLIQYLLQQKAGIHIIAIDQIIPADPIDPSITWIKMSQMHDLLPILSTKTPDFIVNLIGLYGTDDYEALYQANVETTRILLELIKNNAIKTTKILLIGTAAEYGNPISLPIKETDLAFPVNAYGLTKLFQSQLGQFYFHNYQLPVVIARTFNVFGKGLSPKLSLGSFAAQIEKAQNNGTLYVGNIDTKRDFLSIKETVAYYWKLLLQGKPGEIYNVCSGQPVTIRTILEKMIQDSNKKLTIQTDPKRIKAFDVQEIYGSTGKLKAL